MDVAKGALLVPQRAVQELQGAYFVLVVGADGVVAQRMVTTAERVGPLWRITAGLKADEQVIVDGVQKVRPGMKAAAKTVSIEPDKDKDKDKDKQKAPEAKDGEAQPKKNGEKK
jgi:membrane fusion protein (multidrug efflux system)